MQTTARALLFQGPDGSQFRIKRPEEAEHLGRLEAAVKSPQGLLEDEHDCCLTPDRIRDRREVTSRQQRCVSNELSPKSSSGLAQRG